MKRRARLEVAFNFFLVLEEIKFHQQAESQLISKHTKTTEPQPQLKTSGHASTLLNDDVRKQPVANVTNKNKYIYIYLHIYIYTKKRLREYANFGGQNTSLEKFKNRKSQSAHTVDNEAHSPFFLLKWGSPAAAFATAPTHLIVVKRLSSQSQCCFQTLLQLPL